MEMSVKKVNRKMFCSDTNYEFEGVKKIYVAGK